MGHHIVTGHDLTSPHVLAVDGGLCAKIGYRSGRSVIVERLVLYIFSVPQHIWLTIPFNNGRCSEASCRNRPKLT